MDIVYVIVLRLAHVVGGVFWAGGLLLFARFIQPTARASGPAGGQFMMTLMTRQRLGSAMGGAALLTVASGVLLFWRDFGSGNGLSAPMIGFGIGGLAAIVAWIIGAVTLAPAGRRLGALNERLQAGEEVQGEIRALVDRNARMGVLTAGLVFVAVILMAVSRYL